MIRHCVFVKFRSDVDATERAAIHAGLRELEPLIDGMGAVAFGANVTVEPFSRGCNFGFTIDFRDAAGRDAYLAHEIHQRAGARLVAALEGGLDGLLVVDLELR